MKSKGSEDPFPQLPNYITQFSWRCSRAVRVGGPWRFQVVLLGDGHGWGCRWIGMAGSLTPRSFRSQRFLAGDQTWIQGPNLKPGVLSGFLSFLRPKTSICKSAVAGPKSANSPSLNDLLNIFFTSPVVDYFQLCRFVAPLLHRAKPLPQAMGNSKASSRIKDVWICGWSFHLQAHVHGMTDQMKLEGSLLCLSTSLCCILAKVAAVLRIYFKALQADGRWLC